MGRIVDASEIIPIDDSSPSGIDPTSVEELPSNANGLTPEAAINKSPVSLVDRTAMSFGNARGNMNYLKKTYGADNVKTLPDGAMVVNQDGLWHRVDPENLGEVNPWEATKSIIANSPTLIGSAYRTVQAIRGKPVDDSIKGEIAGKVANELGHLIPIGGMVVGGMTPGASIPGAGAGAGLGEQIRTSLGRAIGTYDATPDEQLRDMNWEALLAAGGEVIAPGVRLLSKGAGDTIKRAFEKLVAAPNHSKEMLSAALGETLSSGGKTALGGRKAVRQALDDIRVIDYARSALDEIGPEAAYLDANDVLKSRQVKEVLSLAQEARPALNREYAQNLAELVKKAPENFTANISGSIESVQNQIVNGGFGVIKDGNLVIHSEKEIAKMLGTSEGGLPSVIGTKTRDALMEIAVVLNQYKRYPNLNGKIGAKRLVEFQRAINENFDDMAFSDQLPSIRRRVEEVRGAMKDEVKKIFADNGPEVGNQFLKLQDDFSSKVDAVNELTKVLDSKNPEEFVKRLVSKSSSNNTWRDEIKGLASILPNGAERFTKVKNLEAAQLFTDGIATVGGGNSAQTMVKFTTKMLGQNNPQRVASELVYRQKAVDFLKSMPPSKVHGLVSDPVLLRQLIEPVAEGIAGEKDKTEELLRRAGVK